MTEAVTPKNGIKEHGYTYGFYEEPGIKIPVLVAQVETDKIMDILDELIALLPEEALLVGESSHTGKLVSVALSHVETVIFRSELPDYEDIVLNDGCFGFALTTPEMGEVFLHEHKVIYLYAPDLFKFELVLRRHGVPQNRNLVNIKSVDHIHTTTMEHTHLVTTFLRRFRE